MKPWVIILMGFLSSSTLIAQTDQEAPFRKFPTLPPLELLKTDSTPLTKKDLKPGQPAIIMYFSPSCDHCQHQTEDMISKMDELSGIQIVMATYSPLEELRDFVAKYKLSDYPNIVTGRDTRYLLQPFYKIKGLPYQALYDSKARLLTTFEGNVRIDQLVAAFQKKD